VIERANAEIPFFFQPFERDIIPVKSFQQCINGAADVKHGWHDVLRFLPPV
jgi:hypothetical protein